MSNTFSEQKFISKAWILFKKQWWPFYQVVLYLFIISIVLSLPYDFLNAQIQDFKTQETIVTVTLATIALGIVRQVVTSILAIGWIRSILKIVRGSKASGSDFKTSAKTIVNYILGTLLFGIIVVGGYILLIIPGFIFSIKYGFTPFLIVDRNMGPVQALKASSRMTDKLLKQLFVLNLMLVLVVLAGAVALGVGLFVAIPVAILTQYLVYENLLKRLDKTTPATAAS